jgi:outer membrane protein OmpA-like peptidoglycan-associated protein
MKLSRHISRRGVSILFVLVMAVCANAAQAEELWLDAQGDGEYLLEPLSAISSWSFGGSLGIEARNLFATGPQLRLQLGYGEYLPADDWVSYLRMASAVASVGYRIPLGSSVGLTPYAGGGIGVVFAASAADAASYEGGTFTRRIGTQALGEAGLAVDLLVGKDFELRLFAAYKLMGESGGIYSAVRAGAGVGWKIAQGRDDEPGKVAEQSPEVAEQSPAVAAPAQVGAAQDVDAALSDLKKYANVRIVKEGNDVRIILEAAFTIDSAELSDATKARLDAVGKAVADLRIAKAAIHGHVAPDQDSSTDVGISLARSRAVASWLQTNGYLVGVLIETAGMGRADPVADSSTEESRARNRRVELLLTLE